MSNKLTDNEIKKALGSYINHIGCAKCDFEDKYLLKILKSALDLINRLQARIETLNAENEALRMGRKNECQPFINFLNDLVKEQKETIDKQEAEIKRLQNAYKQCAWERDIFAEDMKEEIKKDCSYLMLDIKTIKAEAYKEAFEKLKRRIGFCDLPNVVVRSHIDNLLNELVGE